MQAFQKAHTLLDERTPEQKVADAAKQKARDQARRAQEEKAAATLVTGAARHARRDTHLSWD